MQPEEVVDDLDPAEDGEASEETHCASNQAKSCLHRHLYIIVLVFFNNIHNYLDIFFYLVKGCRVKVYLDHLHWRKPNLTD